MMIRTLAGLTLAAVITAPVQAADKVKIGFVTTLTTGAGAIGKDMQNAANLAMEHIGGKMGGLPAEIIFEDDGFKPEIGKQQTDKLVKQDKVDFVTGFIWSHVLLASSRSVLGQG
ncbi:MAG: ABC transporter substrate-binding protein, partial [Burkholderiaceae bacterium]